MSGIKVSILACKGNLDSQRVSSREIKCRLCLRSLPRRRKDLSWCSSAILLHRWFYNWKELFPSSPSWRALSDGELPPAPTTPAFSCPTQRNAESGRPVALPCPELRESCQLHAINVTHFLQLNNSPDLQIKQEALKLHCNTECQALWNTGLKIITNLSNTCLILCLCLNSSTSDFKYKHNLWEKAIPVFAESGLSEALFLFHKSPCNLQITAISCHPTATKTWLRSIILNHY